MENHWHGADWCLQQFAAVVVLAMMSLVSGLQGGFPVDDASRATFVAASGDTVVEIKADGTYSLNNLQHSSLQLPVLRVLSTEVDAEGRGCLDTPRNRGGALGTPCEDNNPCCGKWKDTCNSHKTYMHTTCRRTCGTCTKCNPPGVGGYKGLSTINKGNKNTVADCQDACIDETLRFTYGPQQQCECKADYVAHLGKNAYNWHGATDIDNDGTAPTGFSVMQCQQRCTADSSCDCVTYLPSSGKCWKRRSCVPSKFRQAPNHFDVYVRIRIDAGTSPAPGVIWGDVWCFVEE